MIIFKIIKILLGLIVIFISLGGFINKDYILATIVLIIGVIILKSGLNKKKSAKKKESKQKEPIKETTEIKKQLLVPTSKQPINKKSEITNEVIDPVQEYSSELKDFTILDFETTGISLLQNEIIEIGAIKVRNLKIVNEYSTLCNPLKEINNSFIHGIEDSDVKEYKYPTAYMNEFIEFIGDDTIFAYNAPFDIPYLYSYLSKDLPNKIFDVLSFAKDIDCRPSFKLVDIRKDLNITSEEHRSIGDCIATLEYYKYLLNRYNFKKLKYTNLHKDLSVVRRNKDEKYSRELLKNHDIDKSKVDKNNIFYNKKVCFTGNFSKISKSEAYIKIVDLGGEVQKNVTLKTDILVIGEYEHITSKEKKADEYNLRPNINIEKIYEKDFLKLLNK